MTAMADLTQTRQDWILACQVQQRFMQQQSQPATSGLEHSARCCQLEGVGGDFYEVSPLSENRVAILVGDASGTGFASALMGSSVQSSLRTASFFAADDLPLAIETANRQVYKSSLSHCYATCFYGVFDATTRILNFVNAGHHPPMVIRRDGSVCWLEDGGAPVGMFQDWNYNQGTIELNAGDVVVAYTDGIIEAANKNGDEWGIDALRSSAVGCAMLAPNEMIERIFRDFYEHTDGRQVDDASLLVVRVE